MSYGLKLDWDTGHLLGGHMGGIGAPIKKAEGPYEGLAVVAVV